MKNPDAKQRRETAKEILKLRAKLRKRYRLRKTVAGTVPQETAPAPAPRGENPKNMVRKLRRGRQRLEKFRASGPVPTELPPDDPVRKRVERDWQRLISPAMQEHVATDAQGRTITTYSPAPPGYVGRRAVRQAATTTKRRLSRQDEAKALRARGLSERAIVEHMRKTGYIRIATQTDSAIRNVRRWLNAK